jgi:hypothetical protein
MNIEHARNQEGTLGEGHLGDMKRASESRSASPA